MFERFTQKPDHVDVIESSPNFDVSKRKGRLRLKSKVERSEVTSRRPQAPVDEIVLSDFEVEDLEPSLSQMEKEAVAQDGKREGKILGTGKEKEKRERMRVKSDLADRANIQDIGQTRADLDETYFPRGEVEGLDGNLAKRKLSGGEGTSKIEKDKAFEIDLDGDWDTDVSMDKWTSPPPKKMMNSFDFVPEPKETHKFAYKGPVVRGKSERAKLKGWSCRDCQVYYENMNLTEDELQKRMDQCSRHRSKFNERYQTPPGFWNPVFDDTPSTQKTVCE
uniref:RBBP8 protein n=1 Tax=Fopius arisanus TaxID=64838 RepID=A0A0C9R3X8_9HYME